jgi:hypothetical protein
MTHDIMKMFQQRTRKTPLLFHEESDFNETFREQLNLLRESIETLPDAYGQTLQTFANGIEEHHCQMQDGCENLRNLVEDLSLTVKAARFNLWAGQMNDQQRKVGRHS